MGNNESRKGAPQMYPGVKEKDTVPFQKEQIKRVVNEYRPDLEVLFDPKDF
jgi:hypothetical protein